MSWHLAIIILNVHICLVLVLSPHTYTHTQAHTVKERDPLSFTPWRTPCLLRFDAGKSTVVLDDAEFSIWVKVVVQIFD